MKFFKGTQELETRGHQKKAEGYTPHYPVVIIPGLCSSALKVEAGYDKWINKRVWLSIKRMGLEKFRIGNKDKNKFIDPQKPLFTSGFLSLRSGLIFKKWKKYYFLFDPRLKYFFIVLYIYNN